MEEMILWWSFWRESSQLFLSMSGTAIYMAALQLDDRALSTIVIIIARRSVLTHLVLFPLVRDACAVTAISLYELF